MKQWNYLEALKKQQQQKKTRNKNGKIVPYLEITEVILIHGNIVNKCYQQNSRVLYTFIIKNPSG